jgi:hypothetical protein
MEDTNKPGGSLDQGVIGAPTTDLVATETAKKKIRGGRAAIFVIAILSLLVGPLFLAAPDWFEDYGIETELMSTVGIIVIVFGAIFLALGIWSISQPSAPLLIAMILYGLNTVYTLVNMFQNGGRGAFGLLIAGLLLGLIIRGWMGARDLQKINQGGGAV